MIIQATNIHKSFGSLEVLKGIDLTVQQGEIISIVGASGAGKTTLLQILGTLEQADPGASIQVLGEEVTGLGARRTAELRNRTMGFIFQAHQLLPEFTALENIMIPAMILGEPKEAVREKALQLLDRLGLRERASHKPSQLSGGESQRVAVARALINEPAVIFADEPSGSLDTANKESLHQLIFDLRRELGQTFVIVTHDPEFARRADRMIVLKDGRIESIEDNPSGDAPSVEASSHSPYAPPITSPYAPPTTAVEVPSEEALSTPSAPETQSKTPTSIPTSRPQPKSPRSTSSLRGTAEEGYQGSAPLPPQATAPLTPPLAKGSTAPSHSSVSPLTAPSHALLESEETPIPETIVISSEPPTLTMSSSLRPTPSQEETPEDPEEARKQALADAIEQVW